MLRRPLRVRLAAAALLVPLALTGCSTEDDPIRSENGSGVDGDVGSETGENGADSESDDDGGEGDQGGDDATPDPDEG